MSGFAYIVRIDYITFILAGVFFLVKSPRSSWWLSTFNLVAHVPQTARASSIA